MSIDSDARAQLGNVLNVLPQKLHKMEFDASYDFASEIPVSKNMLSLDSLGVAWISEDNPNAINDGNLYLWKKIGGSSVVGDGGGAGGGGGLTLSGVGDGVGSGVGYIDSLFLDIETDPNGLELVKPPGKNPTVKLSDQLAQASNELVIMWTIPEGFRKGLVPFPDTFNVPANTTPTVFTQLIASGNPTPSYATTVSNVTSSGFELELSAQVNEPHQSMNILIKTNEPVEMVGIPELPVGWDWFVFDTEAEILGLYQLNQLIVNSIYYAKDTNRMYILSSETNELVYYQGSPV